MHNLLDLGTAVGEDAARNCGPSRQGRDRRRAPVTEDHSYHRFRGLVEENRMHVMPTLLGIIHVIRLDGCVSRFISLAF